ncbi:MAG: hypothetical protein M1840_002678 [Geoglossum simile]|nr:MAG: hypothetical protein M1840_002678 [Geoglossum simile]
MAANRSNTALPTHHWGGDTWLLNKVSTLLHDFRHHTEKFNLSCAESKLDEVLVAVQGQLETVLVRDADKTLTAKDTGTLFWKRVSSSRWLGDKDCLCETVLGSASISAGLLKALLVTPTLPFAEPHCWYEETAEDEGFDALCQEVASEVTIHLEFISLLELVAKQEHVGVVIVSCGLCLVWEKVLERDLSKTVKVIGGGCIADGSVITAAVKAALVTRLQGTHQSMFGHSEMVRWTWKC